jgi:ABC-type sugar transport system ATPase subunit
MAEVELIGVTKRYGNVEACSNVDLRIPEGEFVTLLGPSGCGKSTTLNLVAGLDEVTSGEIRFDGRVVNDLTPFERDVAMVFQSYALYPHMTVAQNLGFTLKLRRRPREEIRRKVLEVAELLELTLLLDRLPRELSGGQQQRVALGRAVIREPRVFLFDEPFSNLDAALRVRMRSEIRQLHQRLGITSLFVTHDQEEALSISDRVAVMRDGKIVQVGRPEEIYARPNSTYVAKFIGSPQLDILQGLVVREGEMIGYQVGSGWFEVDWAPDSGPEGVDLGIRPEHVTLGEDGVPAVVRVVQPIGPATLVTVSWEGGQLTSRVPGMARLAPGERVRVRLLAEGLLWFDRTSGERIPGPRRGPGESSPPTGSPGA